MDYKSLEADDRSEDNCSVSPEQNERNYTVNTKYLNGTSSQTESDSETSARQKDIDTQIDIDTDTDSCNSEYALSPAVLPLLETREASPPRSYKVRPAVRAVCPATLRAPSPIAPIWREYEMSPSEEPTMAVCPATLRAPSPIAHIQVEESPMREYVMLPSEEPTMAVCPATLRAPSPIAHIQVEESPMREYDMRPPEKPQMRVCPATLNTLGSEPRMAICPATLHETRFLEKKLEPVDIEFLPKQEIEMEEMSVVEMINDKLVDPGALEYAIAAPEIEYDTPVIQADGKGMLKSEMPSYPKYFDVVYAAHITKDYQNLKRLNEKFKDSKLEVNLPCENDWRPLQLAAALGDTEIVRILCEHKEIDIAAEDRDKDTALHAASHWDHTEVIKTILDTGRKRELCIGDLINQRNNKNETPFSYAVSRFNKKSCELMTDNIPDLGITYKQAYPGRLPGDNFRGEVGDFNGSFAKLRRMDAVDKFNKLNEHIIEFHQKDNPRGESPINDMIRKMPDMVTKILDKSIMTTKYAVLIEDLNSNDFREEDIHRVVVDFGALEKFEEYEKKDRGDEEETGGGLIPNHYKYGSNPLQTMTKVSRDLDLLVHPVVEALIITKWERFARTFFYIFTFLFYLIFFGILMAYQAFQITPFVLLENGTIYRSWIENSSHTCDRFPDGCFEEKSRESVFLGYILMVLSSIRLLLELFDIFDHCNVEKSKKLLKKLPKSDPEKSTNKFTTGCSLVFTSIKCWFGGLLIYLSSPENYLEILLYSSTLVFSMDVLDPDTAMTPERWQIGTLSVLAGFINLLLILQVFPKIGIYIIMFFKIAWTFLSNILILLLYFIIAFGVIFHMLLGHTSIFRLAVSGESIFKTLSAGVSGIEYDDYGEQELVFNIATLVGLIVFALFVQVLFLNLATGLAIEDVTLIRDGAEKAMNAIQIKHIYDAERVLSAMRINLFEKRFQNMPARKFKLKTIKDIEQLSVG